MSANEHFRVDRGSQLARLRSEPLWDLAVIGGGSTGLGVAVDAALRGLRVVLLEAGDFAQGTSSRATKLLHGGVRYLAQGHLSLVREALRERATVLRNAPQLSQPQAFVVPAYRWWQAPVHLLGLKAYDALAGGRSLGPTRWLGRSAVLASLPTIQPQGLKGGTRYWDAQFDDARLAIALARSASRLGALTLNHCRVDGLLAEGGRVTGLRCTDAEGGGSIEVQARCVVNAAGPWVDEVRRMADAGAPPRLRVSQGSHVVVDREFWPSDVGLLVPRTRDGRVLFTVPWQGKVILGTTDEPREDIPQAPRPRDEEIDFILAEAAAHMVRPPTRQDLRSVWSGLRPLVLPARKGQGRGTARISREHAIWTEPSGLVCVAGGKWSTYRAMAQEVVAYCIGQQRVPPGREGRGDRSTEELPLWRDDGVLMSALAGADAALAEGLTEQQVRFAVRHEFARTVEDVLARRSRLLFLDARAARDAAPAVASVMRAEGIVQPGLEDFLVLSEGYLP